VAKVDEGENRMSKRAAVTVSCLTLLMAAAAVAVAQAPTPALIETQALRSGLHVLRGAGCNVVVWNGPDGVLVVDSGNAASAPQLLEAIGRVTDGSVRFLVNTHWHPDHVGGNAALRRAGALAIAHQQTRALMAERQAVPAYDLEVPAAPRDALPSVTFDDTLTLHLNGDRLALLHVPGAHGDGDLIAWWETANVVHVGDAYYAGGYPFVDSANGGSLAGLVASLETVLSRADARTVIVPGHGPVSNRAELTAYRDMLVAVGRRVRELVEQGKNLDEVLEAQPTAEYDERYGPGAVSAERFVRNLYADLSGRR
jgi:glyoxylase-like metal-dependent hydrolase (beta-lactamase superfamily II)